MKKTQKLLFLSIFIIGLVISAMQLLVVNGLTTPYRTFTIDNERGLVETSDAYVPKGEITLAGNDPLSMPEEVFIDHENYIYITDSGHSKVFIYDENLNFIDEIEYIESAPGENDGFYAVNSVYVRDNQIYITDSFREKIYIFDREQALNRTPQFYLWLEDVDASDSLTTGDLFYLNTVVDDVNQPTGEAVYRVNVIGENADNRIIVEIIDILTDEVVYQKTDRVDFIGKVLTWITADYQSKTLLRFNFFASKNEPITIIGKPNAPIFQEGYPFAPQKVVVDQRGNMYITSVQSNNGLIMLNSQGEFLTFFAGNPIRLPLVDQIRALMLTDIQKQKLRAESKISIDYISSVAIDEKGFIYTVTSTLEDNVIKKFNVSGKNYFNTNTVGWVGAVDLWVGQYGNIIVVEDNGWINEYDAKGNLMFTFGVKSAGVAKEGLLVVPSGIAIDQNDRLIVVDRGGKKVQIYEPTAFTDAVHQAMDSYQNGNVEDSINQWKDALGYSTIFDLGHIGLGNGYVRSENYDEALQEFQYASYRLGMSNTMWQVRQTWLENHLNMVFLVIVIFFTLLGAMKLYDKKTQHITRLKRKIIAFLSKSRTLVELSYLFEFIKHPLDGFYRVKREQHVSAKTATLIYAFLAVVLIMYYTLTNVLFLPYGQINVLYQLMIYAIILSLWVVANYFVCLISDGEGSFKNVYVSTALSFGPLLLFSPFLILLSNVLTYQEAVFYSIPFTILFIWTAINFFFMIKEIHNYEVGESFNVIFKSIFTMLIMGIFIFVIYSLNSQLFNMTEQIIREVIQR
jgi:sugar lactone lactonase YvrE